MTDLMFHPDSMRDHEAIIMETMRRYQAHFRRVRTLLIFHFSIVTLELSLHRKVKKIYN
jgi:hypothetical protein